MKVMGIDLGGTQIKYGVVQDGRMLYQSQCKTPKGTYADVLSTLCKVTNDTLEKYPDIAYIGLAAPGIIEIKTGVVCYSNNLNWNDAPIGSDLHRATGKTIYLGNDAQCATLGESLFGAGQRVDRVAMLTLGTGVGGGFVKKGKIETDLYGAMAYVFGHQSIFDKQIACNCGRKDCLEVYASATAISKKAPTKTVKEVFDAARSGDADCKKM